MLHRRRIDVFLGRVSAVTLSALLAVSASNTFITVDTNADYTSQINEPEQKQSEIASERRSLEELLNEYEQSAKESAEYMALYDKKMKKQEEEIRNIKEQISLLSEEIANTEVLISDKTKEIDEDIVEFKQRIRTIYMDGNDSMASILVGSTDFYDILMRSELMERVSRHDKEMIDSLKTKINELNVEKAELESSMSAMKEKRSEAETILEDLKKTYDDHQEMKEYYENMAEAQRSKTDEMRAQEAEYEDELQAFIRAQQEENDRIRQEEELKERQRRAEVEEAERAEREEQERADRVKRAEQEKIRRERMQREADKIESERLRSEEARERLVDAAEKQREDEQNRAYENALKEAEGTNYGDSYDEYFDTPNFDDTPSIDYGVFDEGGFNEPMAPPPSIDNNQPEYIPDFEDYGEEDSMPSFSGSMVWPCPNVYNVTDRYGYRTVDEQGGAGEFHKGIDITKPGCAGEDIVAAAAGKVIVASNTGNGYGIHVVIDHGGKLSTLYGHMNDCCVSVGDTVDQGQLIGHIGCTGQAYGNHLHFEVRINGEHTDPMNYVNM